MFSRFPKIRKGILLAIFPLMFFCTCKREERELRPPPPSEQSGQSKQVTNVHAAGPLPLPQMPFDDEENAYAVSQGEQLFTRFNCGTCHAKSGGGDIGPPLADEKWIYGSAPTQIYASIIEGRPNGMPSFRQRITDQQVWQLVAYIRTLSGLTTNQASPGRDDHMKTGPPPNSIEPTPPHASASPAP